MGIADQLFGNGCAPAVPRYNPHYEKRETPQLGVDMGVGERQTVCAACANADGSITILGICEYTGEADSDGGECD